MKAPEKIYLEKIYPDNGILPNGLNYNQSPNDIEYIRTDAFIEKAVAWLKDFINNSGWMADDVGIAEEAVIIDSFITEMKYL